jgi:hypothetical protein
LARALISSTRATDDPPYPYDPEKLRPLARAIGNCEVLFEVADGDPHHTLGERILRLPAAFGREWRLTRNSDYPYGIIQALEHQRPVEPTYFTPRLVLAQAPSLSQAIAIVYAEMGYPIPRVKGEWGRRYEKVEALTGIQIVPDKKDPLSDDRTTVTGRTIQRAFQKLRDKDV